MEFGDRVQAGEPLVEVETDNATEEFGLQEWRPQLVRVSTRKLCENIVIVTEPGIHRPELEGGIQYEDAAVVRRGGAQLLGGTDYGLDD